MKPIAVTSENQADVWLTQYQDRAVPPDGAFKLKPGDYVQISH